MTDNIDKKEINLLECARKLWEARKLLLKVTGVAVVIGIIIAFSLPKEYTVNVVLAPEATRSGRTSVLASMASMFGFGGGMTNEANAVNITLTNEIISSTPFVLDLFDTKVHTLNGEVDTTLVAYFETESFPWWTYVIGAPKMVIGGIRSLFSESKEVAEKPLDPFQMTRKEALQANKIRSAISASIDNKTYITQISVTTQDPLVTASLADTVVNKVQKYITKYKTTKAQEDCKYWEQLYKERQQEYYQTQEAYAKYADANQGIILESVKIEQERLQNEMNLSLQVFTQVATQLQMARAKVQEEKPVFAVLEPATVPLIPSNTSRKIVLVGVVFFALLCTSFWILIGKDFWEVFKKGVFKK